MEGGESITGKKLSPEDIRLLEELFEEEERTRDEYTVKEVLTMFNPEFYEQIQDLTTNLRADLGMDEDDIEDLAGDLEFDYWRMHHIELEIPVEEVKRWETVADIIKYVKKLQE